MITKRVRIWITRELSGECEICFSEPNWKSATQARRGSHSLRGRGHGRGEPAPAEAHELLGRPLPVEPRAEVPPAVATPRKGF